MHGEEKRCTWLASAGAAILVVAGSASTQHTSAHNGGGGGGAGESGTATHQHLDSRFSHNRYYYDRGYAMHRPPAGGANLSGPNGERYSFQGGTWYRWRGEGYRSGGGAWVVVDAPLGMFVPLLPPYYTTIWWRGTPYYYANETWYVSDPARNEYRVVAAPPGRSTALSRGIVAARAGLLPAWGSR